MDLTKSEAQNLAFHICLQSYISHIVTKSVLLIQVSFFQYINTDFMLMEVWFCILHPSRQDDHWEMQTLTLEPSLSANSGLDESNGTEVRKGGGGGGKKLKTARLFLCWQSQQESSEQCHLSHTWPVGSVMPGRGLWLQPKGVSVLFGGGGGLCSTFFAT